MDQGPLVELQIQDGQRLIDRLVGEGIAVTVACWVKESESGQWFLYLATPLVGPDGATRPAYRRVIAVIRVLHQEGFGIHPLEVKVIRPTSPVAEAVLAWQRQHPGKRPTWYRGTRLGELDIEGAYIYPPLTPVHP